MNSDRNQTADGPRSPAQPAAADFLHAAATAADAAQYLNHALRVAMELLGAASAAVAHGEKGRWQTLAHAGATMARPESLLLDALDKEALVLSSHWAAIPLPGTSTRGDILVVAANSSWQRDARGQIEQLANDLAAGLAIVRGRDQSARRIARLEAQLEIAALAPDLPVEQLLPNLAAMSTQLLHAERASIFLWDKPTKSLVARPAIGVAGGELRIADDAGVVGQVIHTGEVRRVDADVAEEQREVDRRVDRRLKFQTRSLVCAPLRTASGDILGAFEVINKRGGNFTADDEQALCELAQQAAAALESTQQWQQLLAAQRVLADQAEEKVRLIGESPAIVALRSTVQRVAETDLAVLILGQNGTGKEVVAQMIHYKSPRRQEPLVAVNCAALPDTLLESELFGHEKGAFTDAREMRRGKFELATGGTLFLDEIGDMSLAGQAKLLRALEDKTITRVGGTKPIATNARVIAATNQNLAELVREHRFREDLYFRLTVVTLELPPLATRGDDILLLAEHFLQHFSTKARRRPPKFTAAARKRLLAHDWPGNIRELRNMMERVAYLAPAEQDKIDAADLPFIASPTADSGQAIALDLPLADATREFQTQFIQNHIDRAHGNMTAAAESLGLQRSNLYRKMRQLGMETSD